MPETPRSGSCSDQRAQGGATRTALRLTHRELVAESAHISGDTHGLPDLRGKHARNRSTTDVDRPHARGDVSWRNRRGCLSRRSLAVPGVCPLPRALRSTRACSSLPSSELTSLTRPAALKPSLRPGSRAMGERARLASWRVHSRASKFSPSTAETGDPFAVGEAARRRWASLGTSAWSLGAALPLSNILIRPTLSAEGVALGACRISAMQIAGEPRRDPLCSRILRLHSVTLPV